MYTIHTGNGTDSASAFAAEGECRAAPSAADLPPPQPQLSTIPGGVGEITFFYGVIKSWEGNAKAISVIIVLCSGVWPCEVWGGVGGGGGGGEHQEREVDTKREVD